MRFGMGGHLPELRPFYRRIKGLGIDFFFFRVSFVGYLRERGGDPLKIFRPIARSSLNNSRTLKLAQ
jgi:hypothetical protein